MENEKELKKDALTDKQTEKVVGGIKKYGEVVVNGERSPYCGETINGTAYVYQGRYYHPNHLVIDLPAGVR